MDVIKPHHVALCILSSMLFYPDEDDPVFAPSVQQKLVDVLMKQVREVEELSHPSLAGLLQQIQAQVGDVDGYVTAEIQKHMGRHFSEIRCPDDLLTLNRLVGDMITNSTSAESEHSAPGADCNAHLGFFLRECYTAFEFMPFEAVCKLMRECQRHLRAGAASLPNWGVYEFVGIEEGDEGGEEGSKEGSELKTLVELERSLNDRIRRVELEVGTAPRAALEAGLRGADVAALSEPKVLLARHVSAVAHADLAASLDSLHHYFDFAGKGQSDWLGKTTIDVATARAQERGRLQSGSLSLGSTHARLGHIEEAMQALNETVRIAQQNSDDVCLCHALAALCHVVDATTPGAITSVTERRGAVGAPPAARHYAQLAQLLQRCLARSEELQLPHLVAFSRLALARFSMLHPQDSAPPDGRAPGSPTSASATPSGSDSGNAAEASTIAADDALRDCAHLDLASRLAAAVIQPLPMSTGRPASKMQRGIPDLFSQGPSVFQNNTLGSRDACARQVEQFAGSAHLLASSSWTLVGAPALAMTHSLALLDSYADVAPAEDQCTALAQLASAAAALHGYSAAEEVLAVADERFPHSQSKALRAARLAVAHDRALHRRDLLRAQEIAAQLAAVASPTGNTDIEIRLEAEDRAARTLAAQGRLEEAASAARRLFGVACEAGQTLPAIRLLVLLGRLHLEAGAPLLALPYLLSALSHCRQLRMGVAGAEVAVMLAQVWLALGEAQAERAQQEMEAVLPTLLAHGSLAQRSMALVALAEVIMTKHDTAEGLAREDARVLELLDEAGLAAAQIEDWHTAAHCHHLAALVHEACGRPRDRNAAAATCMRLQQLGPEGLPTLSLDNSLLHLSG